MCLTGLAKATCIKVRQKSVTSQASCTQCNGTHTPKAVVVEEANANDVQADLDDVKEILRILSSRVERSLAQKTIDEEWQAVARVVDAVFFWISLAVVIVSFVVFFLLTQ
jgi:multidrug efflux pump subunit AcrB